MKRSHQIIVLGLCFCLWMTIVSCNDDISVESHFQRHSNEVTYRAMIKAQSLEKIAYYQKVYGQYFTAGETPFTHLTLQEFAQSYLGGSNKRGPDIYVEEVNSATRSKLQNGQIETVSKVIGYYPEGAVPPSIFSVNWNDSYVTGVRNQGGCGSCWAFGGMAEIQSFFMWKHRLILDLSQQQLVDCVTRVFPSNKGCGGGFLNGASVYAVQYPLTLERNYPYNAKSNTCNDALASTGKYQIKGYAFFKDCTDVTNFLLNVRPIAVCVDIDDKWYIYKGGVIPDNKGTGIGQHCVLLVGAVADGSTEINKNYWIVKNSWGTKIGQYGFYRLYRGTGGVISTYDALCGTALITQ